MFNGLLFVLLLTLTCSAYAEPITAFLAISATVAGITITVGQVLFMMGAAIYGSAQQRRAARKQREAYNASLEDKKVTTVGQDMPVRYVYGKDRVGANIVAMFTSGDKDQYKHMVAVVANHEVTDIENIYLNGKILNSVDSGGNFIMNGAAETRIVRGDNWMETCFFKLNSISKTLTFSAIEVSSDEGITWTNIVNPTNYNIDSNKNINLIPPYNTGAYLIKLYYFPNYFISETLESYWVDATGPVTVPSDAQDINAYEPPVTTYQGQGEDANLATTNLVPTSFTLANNVVTPSATAATIEYKSRLSAKRVRYFKHLGTPTDSADAYLMSQVPGRWTANHLLRGHAYIVLTLDLNEQEFQSGPPKIEALVKGKKLYDPRLDSTVAGGSGTHRYNDSTTWGWTDNPALVALDYITSPIGANLNKADLTGVFSFYQTAANVCSEVITINGANAVKYTANGAVTSEEDGAGVLDKIADSMAGIINGTDWSIFAGKYIAPAVTLNHVGDVVGGLTVTPGASRVDLFNTVKGRFTSPENEYAAVDFKPYIDATYKTADAEELTRNIEYPLTNQTQRIHNLASIAMEDVRSGMTINGDFSYKAWRLRPGDRVFFNSPAANPNLLGMTNKVFRITDKSFKLGEPIKLSMKEDAATIWDQAPAVSLRASPSTNLGDPFSIPDVTGFRAESGDSTLLRDNSGNIITRIKFSWNNTGYMSAGIVDLQYRRHTEDWTSIWLTNYELSTYVTGVMDSDKYQARIRYRNPTIGAVGNWVYLDHLVAGKTAPPPPFDTFLVLSQPDGTRQFNFAYTSTQAPADWMGGEIRYVSGTVPSPTWSSMTKLADNPSFYTSSPVETNYPVVGTWTFACCSIDTSGNYSTMRVVTVDLPQRRVGETYLEYFEHSVLTNWNGTLVNLVRLPNQAGVESTDTTTWDSKTSWTGFTKWNAGTVTSASYTSAVITLAAKISGRISYSMVSTGTTTIEFRYSNDNVTWSAYVPIGTTFTAKYLQVRVSLSGTTGTVLSISTLSYQIIAEIKSEYINDLVPANMTGNVRLNVGDIRIPLVNAYSQIKYVTCTIQDGSAGSWTMQRADMVNWPGPRYLFKLNGALADPASVDFYVEGI